jgi:hypothetical protein
MKITSKQFLQIAVAVGGLVPVVAGLAGIVFGPGMLPDVSGPISLDSHFRYLSGLLLGIGFGFWSCIRRIEQQGARFQLLTVIVFIGGLGRFWSLMIIGFPHRVMLFGLVMELVVTPLLAYWQHRISRT